MRASRLLFAAALLCLAPAPPTARAQCPTDPLWTYTPLVTRAVGSPELDLTFAGRGPTLMAIWSESGSTPVPHVAGTAKWAWSAPTGGTLSNFPSPVPLSSGGDYVFVCATDGWLYKVDASSGQLSGSADTRRAVCGDDEVRGTPAIQLHSFSDPVFQSYATTERGGPDDLVIVVTADQCGDQSKNRVLAYWASNLDPAWEFNATQTHMVDAGSEGCSIDYAGNRATFGTGQSVPSTPSLWAVGTTGGTLAWSHNAGSVQNRPQITGDGRLYVANEAGDVARYDPASGTPIWSVPTADPIEIELAVEEREPADRNRILAVSSAGELHSILDMGATGVPEYPPVDPTPGAFTTAPAIQPALGKAYVGRNDGFLQQVDLGTGALEGTVLIAPSETFDDPTLDSEQPGGLVDRVVVAYPSGVSRACIPFGGPASVEPPASAGGVALAGVPNPFRAGTTLEYRLPRAARVEVAIFGARGERLRTLVNGPEPSGPHAVAWDGRDSDGVPLPSGVYFCRVRLTGQGPGWAETRKLELVR